jgi:hypothetical protein
LFLKHSQWPPKVFAQPGLRTDAALNLPWISEALAICALWFFDSLSLIPFVVVYVSQYLKLGKADDDEN